MQCILICLLVTSESQTEKEEVKYWVRENVILSSTTGGALERKRRI